MGHLKFLGHFISDSSLEHYCYGEGSNEDSSIDCISYNIPDSLDGGTLSADQPAPLDSAMPAMMTTMIAIPSIVAKASMEQMGALWGMPGLRAYLAVVTESTWAGMIYSPNIPKR
ncbi:hypothetical protein ACJJIR_01835 [Microbulbifer sp. SSSA008]|uniref:hypothetical protein n=1 Tax=Microbulbifer sp. SSSA008 TaxID=3243380 RepID=UPI004039D193